MYRLAASTFIVGALFFGQACQAIETIRIWPGHAPGETTQRIGTKLPFREGEHPPVTRVVDITYPTMSVHLAEEPNGAAVVVLPGGGFGKVVPDKEGTEAADWLNQHGISAFVLSYRTRSAADANGWHKPLQDAQRALSLVRSRASEWRISSDKIGLLAFSAGGQVGARLLSNCSQRAYEQIDSSDKISFRPDFALLVYPWNIYDSQAESLVDGISVPGDCPPVFLVHTDDDRSSSLGAVLYYAGLKRHGIPAELHVYGNGGHGYGLREVPGSQISSWTEHAAHWLETRGLTGR